MNETKDREFTLKIDGISANPFGEPYIEVEDETNYILEDDREEVNKYIEQLQRRIRELKTEISHLRGEVEVWEKSWRIWNGKA